MSTHLDMSALFGASPAPIRLAPPTLWRETRGPVSHPEPFNALIVIVPSLGGRKYHLDRGVIRVAREAWGRVRAGLAREYQLTHAGAYGTDRRYEVVAVTGRADHGRADHGRAGYKGALS